MAVVTTSDRRKSVRNRYVIEVLVAFLCCLFAFLQPIWEIRIFLSPYHMNVTFGFLFPCGKKDNLCKEGN